MRVSVGAKEFKVKDNNGNSSEEEDENVSVFARRPEHNAARGTNGSSYHKKSIQNKH